MKTPTATQTVGKQRANHILSPYTPPCKIVNSRYCPGCGSWKHKTLSAIGLCFDGLGKRIYYHLCTACSSQLKNKTTASEIATKVEKNLIKNGVMGVEA